MLPQLPDVLRLIQFSILPGAFHTATAAEVLGQAACPTETALLLRKLYNVGIVEMGPGQGNWRLQGGVRGAAAELAVQLQLPLISARCVARVSALLLFAPTDDSGIALHPVMTVSREHVCRSAHRVPHTLLPSLCP
jgi:hypothetical protein